MIGTVHSSHGEITVDMESGAVIRFEESSDEEASLAHLRVIERFDLCEYFRHYPNESRAEVIEFDILDVGYWYDGGCYEPAVSDFRAEIAPDLVRHGGRGPAHGGPVLKLRAGE